MSQWTTLHLAALKDCIDKGMSSTRTAKHMNATLGTNFSRNAVIGQARRHGWQFKGRPPAMTKSLVGAGMRQVSTECHEEIGALAEKRGITIKRLTAELINMGLEVYREEYV